MNPLLLYLLLLKATLASFSGLSSLPMVRTDLVAHYHVLTDRQLNTAVAVGRTAPGPNGLYIASVGYFVAGVPGAAAGCLALMTPAFLIVPLLRYLGARAESPRVRRAIEAVTIAAAGLLVNITVPLAADAITGVLPALLALGTFVFLVTTGRATAWAMLASALAGLAGALVGMY
ncbi:MAG: chromate transporter [Acidobacteria bacterium]|nr:chromate transporter [Acidobacteriota bacterium]